MVFETKPAARTFGANAVRNILLVTHVTASDVYSK